MLVMCIVYQCDDWERYAMTGSDSDGGASPRSEVAVFRTSAIAVAKCGGTRKWKRSGPERERNDRQ